VLVALFVRACRPRLLPRRGGRTIQGQVWCGADCRTRAAAAQPNRARRRQAANQRKEAWRAADELKDQFRAAESEHARAREVRAPAPRIERPTACRRPQAGRGDAAGAERRRTLATPSSDCC
jgi:hypothetical protein